MFWLQENLILMKKMSKKCSTDQRFIRKRNTTYKIGTWSHMARIVIFLTNRLRLDGAILAWRFWIPISGSPWHSKHQFWCLKFFLKFTHCLKVFHWKSMVFCYQNCSDLLWERIVLVTEKNFWNSRLKAENLQKFWDH